MVITMERKNEPESQKVLRRFVDAVQSVADSNHELLAAWQAVESDSGYSPSDAKGYPYHESLDDWLLNYFEWKNNVDEWARALMQSDAFKMRVIERHLNTRWPDLKAAARCAGAGIYGISIAYPYGSGAGPGQSMFWGTANEWWCADVISARGECIGTISTPVRRDHDDLLEVARAIALYSRDALFWAGAAYASAGSVAQSQTQAPVPRPVAIIPASLPPVAEPPKATTEEQHPEGCPCSKCDIIPF